MTIHRPRGFTLIELLVVLTIISIMLAIAVPSFTSFISNYRATAAINDFLQALVLTRNEAIKQSRSMTLAPVTAGDWRSGWVIFHDNNAGSCPGTKPNAVMDPGEASTMVFRHEALPTSITVSNGTGSGIAFTDSGGLTYVSFDGTGYARQYCSGTQTGGIVMTNTLGTSSSIRTLCLAAAGRPRIVQGNYRCDTSGY